MNWVVVIVGVAVGMAVAFGRVYVEGELAKELGVSPQALFEHRDVLVPFLVLATTANVYAAWLTAAYGGVSSLKLSAMVGMALVVAAQLIQIHIALRPTRKDLDLAVLSCAPYVYLFALYIAALAVGSYSLWLF